MKALRSFFDVTGTFDPYISEDGLQFAFVRTLLDPFFSVGPLHRRCRLARTTPLDMRFQKLPHQFAASLLQFSLQIAFSQAAGLLGAQIGLDCAEAFTSFSEGVTIHRRGLGGHRSALP